MDISVIIPSYKNTEMLVKNLKHNLQFLKGCEIIIVNDYPPESLVDHLKEFTDVKLLENEQNRGFGMTVNRGIEHATKKYILLLNSDVVLFDTSYTKALKHFSDNNMFAVSFAQKEKDDETVGKNKMYWKNGFLQHAKSYPMSTGINGWAEGGTCMIDKVKFLKLGGFDALYAPFYWEDIDLSYRAWKTGYTVMFDADIVVEHHHESTIGTYFTKQDIQTIAYRNQFIFIWKNISDLKLILSHKAHLSLMLTKALIKNDKNFMKGFSEALKRFPHIIKKRMSLTHYRTDHEILAQFNH